MPKRKHFFISVISLFLLFTFSVTPLPLLRASALSLSADSAILIDGKSGEVLFEKNADKIRAMASTTKIMTAVIAIESGGLDRRVRIQKEAVGIEGSSVYLCEGEELTLRQLLYALLLSSANDAATAIAIDIGGDIEGFVALMNRKAVELGLESTHFDNPHGLDSESHYTTARDLASLASYAMGIPEFRSIVSKYKEYIPFQGNENGRLVVNHNKLLRSYSGAVGVKTGYTKKSGRCLVSAAERDGALLIAVTLSAPNDWQDHTALLDFGFDNYESVRLDGIALSFRIPVVSGASDSLLCAPAHEVSVLLPKSRSNIVCRIEADRFLYAPVSISESVGTATFYCDGREIARVDLVALEAVETAPRRPSLLEKIKYFFGLIKL